MTREETLKIMAILRAAYPQYYRSISKQEALDTLNLWTDLFADDDTALVAAAVKALIAGDTREFPPLIGTIKEKMRQITQPKEMTEAEAWGLVAKAIRNSGYSAKKEFDKLPPVIQRIVGSPSQLREWGMMNSETVHSVVASNFQRAYRTMAKREQEWAKLPSDVRKVIGSASERLTLPS